MYLSVMSLSLSGIFFFSSVDCKVYVHVFERVRIAGSFDTFYRTLNLRLEHFSVIGNLGEWRNRLDN